MFTLLEVLPPTGVACCEQTQSLTALMGIRKVTQAGPVDSSLVLLDHVRGAAQLQAGSRDRTTPHPLETGGLAFFAYRNNKSVVSLVTARGS